MSNEVCIVCDWKDANPFPTFIEAEVDGLSVKFDWRDRADGLKELVIATSSAGKNDALIALADQIERHSQYDEPATQFQWASKLREIANPANIEQPPAGARDAVTDAADRIVLWSRGVQPNWWFVAKRSKRPDVNGMPVYETLDPITKATQPAATGAGEGLKDGDLIVGDMAYDD